MCCRVGSAYGVCAGAAAGAVGARGSEFHGGYCASAESLWLPSSPDSSFLWLRHFPCLCPAACWAAPTAFTQCSSKRFRRSRRECGGCGCSVSHVPISVLFSAGVAQYVQAFDAILSGPVAEYINISKEVGGDVQKHVRNHFLLPPSLSTVLPDVSHP